MPTIEDQIALEQRMVAHGDTRFRTATKDAEDNGRGADTSYARLMTSQLIEPVAKVIQEYLSSSGPGVKAKYKKLVGSVSPEQAAYFVLRGIFNHFVRPENIQTLAISIGRMVEDEAKFTQFQKEHEDYYETIIKDFKRKGTKNYRHMHRVLTKKANDKEIKWRDWTTEERAQVGAKLIDCVMQATDLVERTTIYKAKSRVTVIAPTASAQQWVAEHIERCSLLNPDRLPCIIPPDPWVSPSQGGYYTPQVRVRCPLVKTRHNSRIEKAKLDEVMQGVNTIQNTAWKVNKDVFEVMKQVWSKSLEVGLPRSEPYLIPESPVPKDLKKADMSEDQLKLFNEWKREAIHVHTLEKQRVSKCFQVSRVIRMASEFSQYENFWYVYYCDFRGRVYCATASFSPQGPDFGKALIHFAEGKRLGVKGMHWLRVHGANCYGYDKDTYDGRAQWVEDHKAEIMACAEEPIQNRAFWGAADKPWQFLAFCFEYARMQKEGANMISHLPISLDGSCNGLQNFSAMLRDEVGGAATNLSPAKKPADIYTEVATVCMRKLREADDPRAAQWIKACDDNFEGVIPRKLSKRPVMTLPYGSTKQSCTDSIYEFVMEYIPNYFDLKERFNQCVYLTSILWEAIGEVVLAARAAMDWLQECASIISKAGHPIIWTSYTGMVMYQASEVIVAKKIDTQIAGRCQIRLGTWTDKIDVMKQKQGISPNFVHSMDACHLKRTVIKASADHGIDSFAVIHDDYGTHAANTDKLHKAIREAFVELYSEHNPLQDFKDQHEKRYKVKLPDVPAMGTLDINSVLKSEYFFG